MSARGGATAKTELLGGSRPDRSPRCASSVICWFPKTEWARGSSAIPSLSMSMPAWLASPPVQRRRAGSLFGSAAGFGARIIGRHQSSKPATSGACRLALLHLSWDVSAYRCSLCIWGRTARSPGDVR